jgi:hypothetical protein
MSALDEVRRFVRRLDDTEAFRLDVPAEELHAFLRAARDAGPVRREQIETRFGRGLLLVQTARAVSLAVAGEEEAARELLDEVARGAIEHGGAAWLVPLADALDAAGVPLASLPLRLYGLHAGGREKALAAALAQAFDDGQDDLVPHSVLADGALLLDEAGRTANAAKLADRAIVHHVRRKEADPAFMAWMVAEGSGLVPLDSLLKHLRALYLLDPKQTVKQGGALARKRAASGDRSGVLRVLRTIVRESGTTPPYFVPVIRAAFPEAEVVGGQLDLLDQFVDPGAPDPLLRVEAVVRFLPGRYVHVRRLMVGRVRWTDGEIVKFAAPGGEWFEERYVRHELELLPEDDYRVRVRFSPGTVRAWMRDDAPGFVAHVVERNGGSVTDEQLRVDLGGELTGAQWEEWFASVRERLKKDRAQPYEYSLRTISFQRRAPARPKKET